MVRTGKTLTVPDVVEINRRMITHFGGIFFEGDDNLANRGSLEYVLDEIHGSLYGQELYPDLFQKAGLIAWRIIVGHIFHDGNKRTAMESCRLFLELNGYMLKMGMDIIDTALRIATHEIEFDEFVLWLKNRAIEF
jgi:death-on-curing protein